MPKKFPPPINEEDGVLDELQSWFLAQAEREGWVYTRVLRQLVNRMYRDRDYLEKRKYHGRRTPYDYAVDRDQKALAWAIRAIVRYVPDEIKDEPEPPRPARKPSRRLSENQRKLYAGRPSWNGKPKRDWSGPDLPEVSWEIPEAFRVPVEPTETRQTFDVTEQIAPDAESDQG